MSNSIGVVENALRMVMDDTESSGVGGEKTSCLRASSNVRRTWNFFISRLRASWKACSVGWFSCLTRVLVRSK